MEMSAHWRSNTNPKYLRAEIIPAGRDIVVTIKEVKSEEIQNERGESDYKNVLYFEEDVLPMVCNNTNCSTIENIYKTGITSEWIGKKIQIFATRTKVGKESVPCLRIKNVIPTDEKPVFKCSVCGKDIPESTYRASVAKYGKPYCSKECLDNVNKGKDLL